MATFAWKGMGRDGKNARGVRDAESPRALRALLRREGILVTEVVAEAEARRRKAREVDFGRFFRRLSPLELAMTTRQLATLLRAGIPLVEGLSALIEQIEHEDFRTALTQIRDRVNEGTSLADALRAHPKLFSELYVNMVEAGEASGTLELVLARLSEFLEKQAKLQGKVTGALAYPVLMAVLGFAVITLLMVVVVPKITSIFEDFGQALPWYTRLLIATSDLLAGYWWLLAALGVATTVIVRRRLATPEGRLAWDKRLLTLPRLGKLLTMIAISRFARTLATLLNSGVPVLVALDITRGVLGNRELMRVIEEARGSIREGESIAKVLRSSERFPPIVTHMIAVGERSGQIEEMLEHVADSYDAQVESELMAFTSLLGPLMIVVMGAAAGSIAVSIMTPLLQINDFVE